MEFNASAVAKQTKSDFVSQNMHLKTIKDMGKVKGKAHLEQVWENCVKLDKKAKQEEEKSSGASGTKQKDSADKSN